MDSMFKEYHKNSSDGLLRTVNVINGLVEIFAEKFEHKYDRKLLRKFANCRTMHRMKWVQRQMKSHHEETLRHSIYIRTASSKLLFIFGMYIQFLSG